MSDTIQTNATTTSPCALVSVITVLPEHPEVLVGSKLMRGGRCMGSGVQYGTVRDPGKRILTGSTRWFLVIVTAWSPNVMVVQVSLFLSVSCDIPGIPRMTSTPIAPIATIEPLP